MRSDITIGNPFPDYELLDQTDTKRKLSVLQGDDPIVLVLFRGYYCGYVYSWFKSARTG